MKADKNLYMSEDFLSAMAEVIKLLGNPQRLQILEYLDINGESTVSDIVAGINGAQGAVSQHLTKLRMAGVLSCRRNGRLAMYRIAADSAVTILNCMRRKWMTDSGKTR